jgi:hypothetical protein
MKFAMIGAAALALLGAGGVGYTVAGQAAQPEQIAQVPDSPSYEPLTIPTPHTAETKTSSSHTEVNDNSTHLDLDLDLTYTSVVFNEEIELDMTPGDVLLIAGEPEWKEVQSTDFGHDVIWWYGDWGVYFSDGYVVSIDWYG